MSITLICVAIVTKFEIKRENSLLSSNSLQSFKQIKQKTSETLQFNFLLSCSIASVTSYLSENEAENLQTGNVHLAQNPDFEI